MKKGTILFLNGVTSSGKTSIVEALQARRDRFWYVVANDLFQEMVGDEYLREDYWRYLSDAIVMMYYTARMFSDHGKDILIDGILVERPEIAPHYKKVQEIFAGYPLKIVQVYCPLELCRRRNLLRGDRYETQSAEQDALMARDVDYCFRVDTSFHTPEQCADLIMRELFLAALKEERF